MEKLLNQMNKKSIAENITFIKNYIITINNSNLVLVYKRVNHTATETFTNAFFQ